MAVGNVDVYVLDDTAVHTPIEGVLVRLFDASNINFVTQAITNAQGLAAFSLEQLVNYNARFYKDRVSFVQPQRLPATNVPGLLGEFTVYGHVYAPPEALNPRMCCCSGFFRNPDNSPAVNHDVHVIAQFDPLLMEGNAMLTERLRTRSDQRGYVQIELVRFGQYLVTVEGLEDQQRVVTVPDSPSANLPDLLFSVVERITFTPAGPWTVSVGAANELTVTPVVYASSGRVLPGTALQDVQWLTADPLVAVVLPSTTELVIRGLAAGTTTLTPVRWDSSIVRIPNPAILGTPINITVTG